MAAKDKQKATKQPAAPARTFRVWHAGVEAHDDGAREIEAVSEEAAAQQWVTLHGGSYDSGTLIVEAPGGRCSTWDHVKGAPPEPAETVELEAEPEAPAAPSSVK